MLDVPSTKEREFSSVDEPSSQPSNESASTENESTPATLQGTLIIAITVLYFFSLAITAVPIKLLINERIAGDAENPNSESAFVDATSTFLHAFTSFLIGRYSSGMGDFIGRKPVLVTACSFFVLSRILYLVAETPSEFYIGAIFGGMFDCFYFSALAWLSDIYPVEHERSRWVGMYTGIVGGFAFVVGIPVGVVLASNVDNTFPLRLAVVLGVVVAAIVIVLPVDDTIGIKKQREISPSSSTSRVSVRDGGESIHQFHQANSRDLSVVELGMGGDSVHGSGIEMKIASTSSSKRSVAPQPESTRSLTPVQVRIASKDSNEDAADIARSKAIASSDLLKVIKADDENGLNFHDANSVGSARSGGSYVITPRSVSGPQNNHHHIGTYILWGNRGVPDNAWLYLVDKFPISLGTWNMMSRAKYPANWVSNFTMHCTSALLNLILIQYSLAIFDWSPLQAAAGILFIGLCLGIFAPVLLHRFSPLPVAFYTMLLFTVGLVFVSIAGTGMQDQGTVNTIAVVGLICLGLGTAWVPALQTNLLSQYKKDEQGEVSGLLGQQNDVSLLPAYIMSLGFTQSLNNRGTGIYWPGSAFAAAVSLGILSLWLHWKSYGKSVFILSKRVSPGSVYVTAGGRENTEIAAVAAAAVEAGQAGSSSNG